MATRPSTPTTNAPRRRRWSCRHSLKGRFALAFVTLAILLAVTAHYARAEASGKGFAWHANEVLWTLLTALPFGLTAGWLLMTWLLRPLSRIERAAEQISQGHFHTRIDPADVDVEIAHLAETLNTMLDRLENVRTKLTHFSDNLVHEVLGPVHAIQLQVEVGESPARTKEELQTCVNVIGSRANHLETICEALLAFSRSVMPDPSLLARLDLEPIIEASIERVAPLSSRVGVDVVNRAGSVIVRGEADLLELVLTNLIGNAVSHSPRGAAVEVAVRNEPHGVGLLVIDHGHGVTADAEPHMFEHQFSTREQPTREHHGGGTSPVSSPPDATPTRVAVREGHGVGLAICRSIMEGHGGRVCHEHTPGGGATFVLHFPTTASGLPAGGDSYGDRQSLHRGRSR